MQFLTTITQHGTTTRINHQPCHLIHHQPSLQMTFQTHSSHPNHNALHMWTWLLNASTGSPQHIPGSTALLHRRMVVCTWRNRVISTTRTIYGCTRSHSDGSFSYYIEKQDSEYTNGFQHYGKQRNCRRSSLYGISFKHCDSKTLFSEIELSISIPSSRGNRSWNESFRSKRILCFWL